MKLTRSNNAHAFAERLLAWAGTNLRTFPWRLESDPYKILVVEQLLRQTTARQVEKVYQTFFDRFPSFDQLAQTSTAEIAKIIKPLGIQHKRSDLLNRLGSTLSRLGRVPDSETELLALPGVGQYAANAVLCLGHGKALPMVDRNAVRLTSRVFSFPGNHKRHTGLREVHSLLTKLIPHKNPALFNYAVLDLAATVCKPKCPNCSQCPLTSICSYYSGAS